MIFAAHPDDEIIGPGGTAHMMSCRGAEVDVVSFTCGGTAAKNEEETEKMICMRRAEMKEADQHLGVTRRHLLELPSQQLYGAAFGDNSLHRRLIGLLRRYKPQLLLSHSGDNHRDHDTINRVTPQVVFQAQESIMGELGEPWRIPLVLYFGIELDPQAENVIIEISAADLEAKLKAIRSQLTQARDTYLQRIEDMIEAKAALAGSRNFGAGRFAETFYLDASAPMRFPMA